jgi:leucyl aminopeptidase
MGGAAAVAGALYAIAARKALVNVVGVLGLVENMPSGTAQRPGDIVRSMSGQTIEILNTDAEGRLVLADALWYTQKRFSPRFVVDAATLTGAIVATFGHEFAGLFSNDDALASAIAIAGAETDEPVWRLPMAPAYDKLIESPNADVKNIGGPKAGSITAAQFLQRFTNNAPWAHLDIASTAWKAKHDDPRQPVWGGGWGVRLLDRLADAPPGAAPIT